MKFYPPALSTNLLDIIIDDTYSIKVTPTITDAFDSGNMDVSYILINGNSGETGASPNITTATTETDMKKWLDSSKNV